MNLNRMIRALVLAVLASALVYAVLIMVSDGPEVARALSGFRVSVLLSMIALSTGCYFVRAARWRLLMRSLGHSVSFKDGLYLHLAGQTMTISPGRVGEVLKPWLSRQVSGMPITWGLALVFSERVADLIAVSILALGGLSVLGAGVWTLLAALGAIVVGTLVASSQWFHRLALGFLAKQSWAQKHHASMTAISETIRTSLSWRTLAWSVSFSVVAWGLEGIAFALGLSELGFHRLAFGGVVSTYAVSTIVGAFTFLPGGIGLTEASMAGILVTAGMTPSAASAATLLTRVVTLWWGVLVGWLVLFSRPVLFKRLLGAGKPGAPAEDDSEDDGDTLSNGPVVD